MTGGVSHGSIELPVPAGVVPIRVTGGVNDLTVTRPAGTGAILKVRGGAVNVSFDGQRSGAVGGTASWLSREGADGDDRYEIEIVGGARTLVVTTRLTGPSVGARVARFGVAHRPGTTADSLATADERWAIRRALASRTRPTLVGCSSPASGRRSAG